jgi:crotonobetainyl-CoA:carnitine CoA-transferase CaiB-like acyl-CoA transferase
MTMPAIEALASVWRDIGMPEDALADLQLQGADPVLPSSFAIGTAAQAAIAASALGATTIGRLRGLPRQSVSADMRHAATEFHSERWLLVNGQPPGDPWDKIAGTYQCRDGRWVRLHTNFPHHREGVLRLLGCEYDRAAVAAALQRWDALAFEDAAAEAGLCVTAMRSFAEWDAHPQGRAVQTGPLIAIEEIGTAPPQPPSAAARPLGGLRVLDLTRVIAGPVCGRTLAVHGADVLLITGPHLYNPLPLTIDGGRGKLSAQLDLRANARETLRDLLRGADVFVQGYRPGALAARGFGPDEAASLRPGIVYVSLAAYGHSGPWHNRRGFDSLNQTATGFNHAEAEAAGEPGKPKPLPVQALDHASAYFMALGAMAALYRRATVGGSWHVKVSLARTGHWIRGLGRVANGFTCPAPGWDDVSAFLEEVESGFGRLTAVRHAGRLSETPPAWVRPSMPPGSHPAVWPAPYSPLPVGEGGAAPVSLNLC